MVIGGSGDPYPGSGYVGVANGLYIDNPLHPNFPGTTYPAPYANGLYTPEQWYPIEGVHNEYINYPNDAAGFSDQSTSVGQGVTILENAINTNFHAGDVSTVFGYSQSAIIASQVMEQLDPTNTPGDGSIPQADLQFLLIGDPNNPNGGLLERFNGFETTAASTVHDELNLPSLGVAFDGATPADAYPTDIYTLEYDGLADFPRYPLNFLSDLNAFLGFAEIHGTYLNGARGRGWPHGRTDRHRDSAAGFGARQRHGQPHQLLHDRRDATTGRAAAGAAASAAGARPDVPDQPGLRRRQ